MYYPQREVSLKGLASRRKERSDWQNYKKIADTLINFTDFISVSVKIRIANVSGSGNFSGFFEFLEEKLHSEHCIKIWIVSILP